MADHLRQHISRVQRVKYKNTQILFSLLTGPNYIRGIYAIIICQNLELSICVGITRASVGHQKIMQWQHRKICNLERALLVYTMVMHNSGCSLWASTKASTADWKGDCNAWATRLAGIEFQSATVRARVYSYFLERADTGLTIRA